MTAGPPIVYVEHSEIRDGALEQFRAGIRELVGTLAELEPELPAYSFYVHEDGVRLRVVHIHRDPASLEYHMEVGGPLFRRFAEMVHLRSIEVYGEPSEAALEQLREKARMLGGDGTVAVYPPAAGFARLG